MEITPVRLWASPSTLHLRVMVTSKNGSWSVFKDIHVPKDQLPAEDLAELIRTGTVDELEPQVQPKLW